MMIERLKKPGSPARISRKHKLRSPSPAPPQVTPTPDTTNVSKDAPPTNTLSTNVPATKSEENGIKNTPVGSSQSVHVPAEASGVEIVEIDSSVKQVNSEKGAREMNISEPLEGTNKDFTTSDPVVDTNSHLEKSKTLEQNVDGESKNDTTNNILTVNRKRTSPTSFLAPLSKRTKVPNIENVSKTNKSPSPAPMLAPIRSSGLLSSSASQVLNEEFKRKQTTENLKIKQLITREIRKHSKSKLFLVN